MKIATSATVFKDGVGMRLSYTYSEIDDVTGQIISDNNRGSRVITDAQMISKAEELLTYAQESVT